jgi:hypothetical protein
MKLDKNSVDGGVANDTNLNAKHVSPQMVLILSKDLTFGTIMNQKQIRKD